LPLPAECAGRGRTLAQEYKSRTQQLNAANAEAEAGAEAVRKAAAAEAGDTEEPEGSGNQADANDKATDDHLPMSRVKRIIKCVLSLNERAGGFSNTRRLAQRGGGRRF
jgi:hypothetical protein